MQNARCDGLAIVLVAACALGLGACRHAEEPGSRVYGSLKDDPVATSAKPRPKKVAAAAPVEAPPARAMSARSEPVAVAAPPIQQQAAAASPVMTASASPGLAATPARPLAPVDDDATATRMLSEGEALFDAGKVVQARRLFLAAMNGPVPDVVLALARSYDTYYLSRLPSSDAPPDMQLALILYERAMERGAVNAAADLERTRGILKIPR